MCLMLLSKYGGLFLGKSGEKMTCLGQEVQVGGSGEHFEEEDGEERDNIVLGRLDAVVHVGHAWLMVQIQADVARLALGGLLLISSLQHYPAFSAAGFFPPS